MPKGILHPCNLDSHFALFDCWWLSTQGCGTIFGLIDGIKDHVGNSHIKHIAYYNYTHISIISDA